MQCNDTAMHVYLRLSNANIAWHRETKAGPKFSFCGLRCASSSRAAFEAFEIASHPYSTGFPFEMESLQPTPLMAFDHSKIELVCAVHVFTSVAQCIGSILSWVSFSESSENLLADIESCIVLQYCCHVVRQKCIEVPAKQMSVENPLDSANLRGTINFACLFLLRKYVNYWLQFWMFLMSIGPICSSPFSASCSAQNPQTW